MAAAETAAVAAVAAAVAARAGYRQTRGKLEVFVTDTKGWGQGVRSRPFHFSRRIAKPRMRRNNVLRLLGLTFYIFFFGFEFVSATCGFIDAIEGKETNPNDLKPIDDASKWTSLPAAAETAAVAAGKDIGEAS